MLMITNRSTENLSDLYAANTPDSFWKLLVEPCVSQAEWVDAMRASASILPQINEATKPESNNLIYGVLGEAVFGPRRWQLSLGKRLYYEVKPMIPKTLSTLLRQGYRRQQESQFALGWPIEDRYVQFQFHCVAHALRQRGLDAAPYVNFWPDSHHFALVLTHDIETEQGYAFVETIADLEERLGFRSVFNFVPERYPVDRGLLSALRRRGFEIGVHGLKHDGKLFSSRQVFEQKAAKINQYLQVWEAAGFRAPYMHRNPAWLQALNLEYDLSFFDTDPYEPMPGGTMSVWPFILGSFVELPYTLVQDHTLMIILGERTPRLWLNKVDFIERCHGMALVNTHPDYLRRPEHLAIYEDFLHAMKERENYWHALPQTVAYWWRQRAQFRAHWCDGKWDFSGLSGATLSYFPAMGDVSMISEGSSRQEEVRRQGPEDPATTTVRPSSPAFKKIGAVVVGGDFQGLGIVRSLGRHHVPVCIIDDERSVSRFSRYATHTVQVASLHNEHEAVKTVLEVGQRLGLEGWVLYPTRDETVAAFSRHRSILLDQFRVPTPDWNAVQWAWDKRNTYRLAEELAIPAPRTWYPQDLSELEQIEAGLPLVIKPAIKEHFFYATRAKAWRANTHAELVERFQQALALTGPGEVMIQELIPGDGQQQFSYCAFFKDGRAVGSMVAQRRRQHPPEFGRASTFVETIELPILETLSERILQAIDYYGLVELEYKLDLRDGQYKLLDINARTWGYHSVGLAAGVDFPYLLYSDQTGEAVEVCRAKTAVRWIRLITDLPTGIVEMIGGHLDWRTYLRSLKGVNVESVFSREDPLPGLVETALIPYLYVKRGF